MTHPQYQRLGNNELRLPLFYSYYVTLQEKDELCMWKGIMLLRTNKSHFKPSFTLVADGGAERDLARLALHSQNGHPAHTSLLCSLLLLLRCYGVQIGIECGGSVLKARQNGTLRCVEQTHALGVIQRRRRLRRLGRTERIRFGVRIAAFVSEEEIVAEDIRLIGGEQFGYESKGIVVVFSC